MIAFHCRVCGAQLFFENSVCISCGSALGYARQEQAIVPVDEQGRYVDNDGLVWWVCANLDISGCTWLARLQGGQCEACDLTRTRPEPPTKEFQDAEIAKRHLVFELDRLGLPVVSKLADPENGLAFDLLQSDGEAGASDVVIGHESGLITIDLAESDDAYREKVREQLDEPYRTMLGHFRHETGHYYEWQLVRGEESMAECTRLFGDETASYEEALQRHYAEGPPVDWAERYISTYATMHPFEDFAETFAHYLHIRDTIESAIHHGLAAYTPLGDDAGFRRVVLESWIPLTTALNVVNRSMGRDDLYPFVIPAPVLDKLEYVAGLVPR
jgi:hypothetical protein